MKRKKFLSNVHTHKFMHRLETIVFYASKVLNVKPTYPNFDMEGMY